MQPGVDLGDIGAGEHLLALRGRDFETATLEHSEHRLGLAHGLALATALGVALAAALGLALGLPLRTALGLNLALPPLVDTLQVHRQLSLIFALPRRRRQALLPGD